MMFQDSESKANTPAYSYQHQYICSIEIQNKYFDDIK